jgi:hypothetical protein
MNNTEKKQEVWGKVYPKVQHLENYCKIKLNGIDDDDNIYFHPTFIFGNGDYIHTQMDITHNYLYGIVFHFNDGLRTDIQEDLLDYVVVGHETNYEKVKYAMETLIRIKSHINNINNYVNDYIINLLIGSGVEEVSNLMINDLKSIKFVFKALIKKEEK